MVFALFGRWTLRVVVVGREAASASELAVAMVGVPSYEVPAIVWDRTTCRVMTLDWIDGIKISHRDALIAAGHDMEKLSANLVNAFLRQAIAEGFFHADMHQGNLFVKADGTIAAVDFGIMGRINRQARYWLAEILYGLTTGNYRRVAEIHFESQYVPDYHNVEEFATALRAVGEPMRGKPVSELSVGQMLDGLFAITRDFDMQTQPHLLLLQDREVRQVVEREAGDPLRVEPEPGPGAPVVRDSRDSHGQDLPQSPGLPVPPLVRGEALALQEAGKLPAIAAAEALAVPDGAERGHGRVLERHRQPGVEGVGPAHGSAEHLLKDIVPAASHRLPRAGFGKMATL